LQGVTWHAHKSDPDDPDLALRCVLPIGGATAARPISLVVNSDTSFWTNLGLAGGHGTGVGLADNTADTGVIVNGDNVTAYGFFVEHYQKYEVM